MKQQRNTRQRELVLQIVKSHHDHPSADDIYLEAREKDDKISRGTVYRNLKLLAESGEILHVKIPSADRFDSRLDYHYHVICTKCGAIMDLALPYNDRLDAAVWEETGYIINRHRIIFDGICSDCQNLKLK